MEFPLGPALANIFVGFYETKLFSNASKPHMYHRNVEVTYAAFNSEECNDFFSLLNSFYLCLHFAFEKECNGFLSFLDVLVEKSEVEFITSVC